MSLKPAEPCYTSVNEDDECIDLGVSGEYIDIGPATIHHSHIPDIIEFLKIAQAWIDANKDNA